VPAKGVATKQKTNYDWGVSQWHKFDDNKVTVATERQVLGEEAYLLMYTVRNVT
jgi:hypothetical protein